MNSYALGMTDPNKISYKPSIGEVIQSNLQVAFTLFFFIFIIFWFKRNWKSIPNSQLSRIIALILLIVSLYSIVIFFRNYSF